MSMFMGDASEIYGLGDGLAEVGAKTVPAVRQVMSDAGDAFANEWRSNATETSGEHGKHYPASITSELAFSVTSVAVDVGPESARKQGGMGRGFEFGSVNQPPHLDGLRALDGMQARLDRILDSAIGHLFP